MLIYQTRPIRKMDRISPRPSTPITLASSHGMRKCPQWQVIIISYLVQHLSVVITSAGRSLARTKWLKCIIGFSELPSCTLSWYFNYERTRWACCSVTRLVFLRGRGLMWLKLTWWTRGHRRAWLSVRRVPKMWRSPCGPWDHKSTWHFRAC